MRSATHATLVSLGIFGASFLAAVPTARAQEGGLGGFGAMAGGTGSPMGSSVVTDPSGMGGGTVEPFGGRFGASMSSGMGGGGTSFRPRPSAGMGARRTTFTIGPMGGGMSGGMGMGLGSSRRPFALQGPGRSAGSGLGGMRRRMPAARGMGVMPPSFGSPFRQPPSLLNPSSSGVGMSM